MGRRRNDIPTVERISKRQKERTRKISPRKSLDPGSRYRIPESADKLRTHYTSDTNAQQPDKGGSRSYVSRGVPSSLPTSRSTRFRSRSRDPISCHLISAIVRSVAGRCRARTLATAAGYYASRRSCIRGRCALAPQGNTHRHLPLRATIGPILNKPTST